MLSVQPKQDQQMMRKALRLAYRGRGKTATNPMVGAVLVAANGHLIGCGYHTAYGAPHAEVAAIGNAYARGNAANLARSTMYVTLEPCDHHGKTPPCSKLLIENQISRVVYGQKDPYHQVSGSGIARLEAAGVKVCCEPLGGDIEHFYRSYNHYVKTGRPYVIVKVAQSLDGKIATAGHQSQWITGPDARRAVHRVRAKVDAILTGIGTVLADNPSLTPHLLEHQPPRSPWRIVLDSQLRLDPKAKIVSADGRCVVVTGPVKNHERARALTERGCRLVVVEADAAGRPDLKLALLELGKLGICHLLVEAGGQLCGALQDAKLIDHLLLFVAPIVIGGAQAPGAFSGRGVQTLADASPLQGLRLRRYGQDLCLEGSLS